MRFDNCEVIQSKEMLRQSMLAYAVTDRSWLGNQTLYEQVEQAILGGATFVQLREKDLDEATFLEEAKEIKELCHKYHVPFVINDNVAIAQAVDADGVHVGQSDMEAGNVRKILGENKIIGVSAQTVEQAVLAQQMGADYLGVGAVFSTSSKNDADDVTHETLQAICQAVDIPVVAIGGISKNNVHQLSNCGIDGVAVISAIFAQNDIRMAAGQLKRETVKMLQRKVTGAIFDIDGTLLDSMMIWDSVGEKYLEQLHITPKPGFKQELTSMTLESAAAHMKKEYDLAQSVDEIIGAVLQIVEHFYLEEVQLRPGVEKVLSRLKEHHIPMVLATTGNRRLAMAALKRLGVADYFNGIFTASELHTSKNEPLIFQKAAEFIKSPLNTTMVVEDSFYAVTTAKKEGCICVGIYDEYSSNRWDELERLADVALRDWSQGEDIFHTFIIE